MSHEFKSGFSVRKPMWHGLGTIIDRVPESVDEVLELTFEGNPWEPEYTGVLVATESKRCESREDDCRNPATYKVKKARPDGSSDTRYACKPHAMRADARGLGIFPLDTETLEGYQAIRRGENGPVLHVSQTSFETFGNRESAELLVEILQGVSDDGLPVNWETGLQLKDGGLIVFCASIDTPYEVKGDPNPIFPFSSIHNYHDGSGAMRIQNTSIRPVCWNTASAAEMEGERTGRQYSFRHTRNIRDHVEAAKQALFSARTDTEKWIRYANELVAIPLSDAQFNEFIIDFVPEPPKSTKRVLRNVEAARESIRSFYHSPTTAAVAGTAWGAVCAATEFLDHGRNFRTKETYVTRSLLKPEYGKTQAYKLVEEIVGADRDQLMLVAAGN